MKILELTYEALTDTLHRRYGKGKYHAAAVYREIYRNGNRDFGRVPEFSKSQVLARELEEDLELDLGLIVEEKEEDGLTKFVTRLEDDQEIETVVIPMATHKTLCVSSQVGCRMGCSFCETGQMGWRRNLTVEEIVAQVYTAKVPRGHDIRNIVFMGMGEPFDNFANVIQAIRVINDPRGLDVAKSHITVSTAGRVDGIRKLAALNWPQLNLAISLNASNDWLRSQIMPINRAFPMDRLRQALLEFPLRKSGTFFVEYVLIKGLNDGRRHARELAAFLRPIRTKLNLIPYNPRTGSPFKPPTDEDLNRFCGWLVDENVFVRKRATKGRDVRAACGQLGNRRRRQED